MDNHGVNASGGRKRPFQFPLLAGVIVTAGLIAVVNEVMKGGQLARSMTMSLPAMDGIPVTEHKRVPISTEQHQTLPDDHQTARQETETKEQPPDQEQQQETKKRQATEYCSLVRR